MTPTELIDSARTSTRDRLSEVDTDAMRATAATNLAHAREIAEERLHEVGQMLDEAGHFLDEAGHFLETRLDDVSEALEDDETRSQLLVVLAALTGIGIIVWAVRRRRAKREAELEEALYESTMEGVPGWTDPAADKIDLSS